MTFLPIVERELRVRARLKSTYRLRLWAALASAGFGGFLLVFVAPFGFWNGRFVFGLMAFGAFVFSLFEGVRNTADCLSAEKREGTLGLLFLTDLRGYDVVLGKLMATSLSSFYALLSILPPLAIPLILGGVTGGEFGRLALVLTNTLFFSLTAGLLVSALNWNEGQAWRDLLALLLWFAAIMPALELLPGTFWDALANLSPTTAFLSSFDSASTPAPRRFWWSVASIHLLAWGFLAGASLILPKTWREGFARVPESKRRRFVLRWGKSNPERTRRKRLRMLEANPALWLASRHREQPAWLWAVVLAASVSATAIWIFTGGNTEVTLAIFGCFLILHFGLALWVASVACRAFADARDSGALELLLSTPLTIQEIVRGQVLALRAFFFQPLLILFLVEVGIFLFARTLAAEAEQPGRGSNIVLSLFMTAVLAVSLGDLYAVGYYGLWMGLKMKKPSQAISRTILLVLVLPLVAILFCFILWPITPLVILAKSIFFTTDAQNRLIREFRNIVMTRFDSTGATINSPLLINKLPDGADLPSVLHH